MLCVFFVSDWVKFAEDQYDLMAQEEEEREQRKRASAETFWLEDDFE